MTVDRLEKTDSLQNDLIALRARRKSQKKATGRPGRRSLTKAERVKVFAFTDGKCHVCGGDIDGEWQADHIRAHSTGGTHALDNYLPAHGGCNNYRWDYLPEEIRLILKLGVWAKTQVVRGTRVGQKIEDKYMDYESARITRRVENKRGT